MHLLLLQQMRYGCWRIPSIPSFSGRLCNYSLERQHKGKRCRSDETDGRDLKAQGIVERVFAEPEEYIVQNMDVVIMQMDEAIEEFLMKYKSLSEQELIEHRYERFRNM